MARLIEIKLKYCIYEVWMDDENGTGSVRTVFPDGLSCGATRDENDPLNIKEAEAEGYSAYGKYAVWRSLIDHEFLHSLISEVLFDRPSLVLREQAGDRTFIPARLKYEEEVLVLSFQEWLNKGIDCNIERRKCFEIRDRHYNTLILGGYQ